MDLLLLSSTPAGTQVLDIESEKGLNEGKVTIKGFATIDNVCLINIEGTGMVGVPGKHRTAVQEGTHNSSCTHR